MYIQVLCIHIHKSNNSLLPEAFILSQSLYTQNKNCWFGCIDSLAKYLDLSPILT